MTCIEEYSETTSAYELFFFLYNRIIKREITTFEQLVRVVQPVPEGEAKTRVLKNGFLLIIKLNWGFFSQLTPDAYPKLWEQLTVLDRDYHFGADLKRNMTITNIYMSFIDIHGYTSFCLNSGINTSRLQKLDEFIGTHISQIAKSNHVLSRRMRGDEIILAGSSAVDIVETTVQIADYFSGKKLINSSRFIEFRSSRPSLLPDMTISAGIAGGKKFTPLVVTSDGDLSGTVVNTAARLQGQANKVSKDTNRILTTNHVVGNYIREASERKETLLSENYLDFLNAGYVSFKGVGVTINEIIIDKKERFRMSYQKELLELIDSLKKNLWNEKIFMNLLNLVITASEKSPPFVVSLNEEYPLNNSDFSMIAKKALSLFHEKLFVEAVEQLEILYLHMKDRSLPDYFTSVYTENILNAYRKIITGYSINFEKLIDGENRRNMSPEERDRFNTLKTQAAVYEKLKNKLYNKISKQKRKIIWTSTVNLEKADLVFQIYFGK